MSRFLLAALLLVTLVSAQLLIGRLEGTIVFPGGRPRTGAVLAVTGPAGFEITVHTDSQGRFALVLPYGLYRVGGVPLRVDPLAATHADMVLIPPARSPRRPAIRT
jgi:hypothetical protein